MKLLRKLILLSCLLILSGSALYAQKAAPQQVVGQETALQQIPAVNALAEQVNVACEKMVNATNTSRAMAGQCTATYTKACEDYLAELKKNLSAASGNEALTSSLKREIELVTNLMNKNQKTDK